MTNLHVSRHAVVVVERVVELGFVAAIAVLATISAATLIYAWFIA
jgi:hypothetical protein